MKGKEKRKGKEKETCNRASTNNLGLILTRVISFGVPVLFSFYYARYQITSIRNSGNPALVFQHLSFQSYHVIHQQEHNTVDWRTVEKTQQN